MVDGTMSLDDTLPGTNLAFEEVATLYDGLQKSARSNKTVDCCRLKGSPNTNSTAKLTRSLVVSPSPVSLPTKPLV